MKTWYTEIRAIDPSDGKLKTWGGEYIKAPTPKLAQAIANSTGRGYLKVTDKQVISEWYTNEKGDVTKKVRFDLEDLN